MNNEIRPIAEIAEKLKIPESCLLPYGPGVAKLKLDLLADWESCKKGKLIMVTAVTPTPHGEGKTVVSIGLTQAMAQMKKKVLTTLREPSLGPVFGLKGGATGGGRSQVIPAEKINLHFTGDFHAITSAHNLLAAAVDSHIHHGHEPQFEINSVTWPRAMDMNDRALRNLIVGLGGKSNGAPRETGFVITAASEIMAVLGLAESRQDLRRRLESIVVGYDGKGQPIRAGALKITGALMVLLNEAIMPNLVQTTEHVPALVHTGPFANIAYGTSSVISQRMALKLADYVVNESGFGADLGAEKYFDIVMAASKAKPSAAVLIATARALTAHGAAPGTAPEHDLDALGRGMANLAKHLENLRKFRVPVIVAINRFHTDTNEELEAIRAFCREAGVDSAVVDVFERGGEGALELAEKVCALADRADSEAVCALYPSSLSLEEKIERIATEIYGARGIHIESDARKRLKRFADLGFGAMPICMAKTPASLTDNPKLLGAPSDWTLTVTDAFLSAGAGFVVAVAGSMLLMPGLPKAPQALKMDVDDQGNIFGVS
ncbi:MAG: formate--tetrahydrofolate ligase [Blastocatellia bacterium]|nr:formate--tetrahydrofolate ligase [Blastocatellia bacterium]